VSKVIIHFEMKKQIQLIMMIRVHYNIKKQERIYGGVLKFLQDTEVLKGETVDTEAGSNHDFLGWETGRKEKEPVEEDLAQSRNKKIVHVWEGSIDLFFSISRAGG